MSLVELLALADLAEHAVRRATSTWIHGMPSRVGATRCPSCRVVGSLHYKLSDAGLIEYRCDTVGCVLAEIRKHMGEQLKSG